MPYNFLIVNKLEMSSTNVEYCPKIIALMRSQLLIFPGGKITEVGATWLKLRILTAHEKGESNVDLILKDKEMNQVSDDISSFLLQKNSFQESKQASKAFLNGLGSHYLSGQTDPQVLQELNQVLKEMIKSQQAKEEVEISMLDESTLQCKQLSLFRKEGSNISEIQPMNSNRIIGSIFNSSLSSINLVSNHLVPDLSSTSNWESDNFAKNRGIKDQIFRYLQEKTHTFEKQLQCFCSCFKILEPSFEFKRVSSKLVRARVYLSWPAKRKNQRYMGEGIFESCNLAKSIAAWELLREVFTDYPQIFRKYKNGN